MLFTHDRNTVQCGTQSALVERGRGYRTLGRFIAVAVAACLCTSALSADTPHFQGRVVMEVVDALEFNHKLRLLEDFSFHDEQGKYKKAKRCIRF